MYSEDNYYWEIYKEDNEIKTFKALQSAYDVSKFHLKHPIKVRVQLMDGWMNVNP